MSARRGLALAGGAALAAGLVLGFMADRLRRFAPPSTTRPVTVVRNGETGRPAPIRGEDAAGDVLERFRLAAAV